MESMIYRVSALIDSNQERLVKKGETKEAAKLKGIEEYALECSICKVLASEFEAYNIDEGLQIYGGMGYSGEAPMEAHYRDGRISRIYEGTNEINRMLCVGMLLKSAMKGYIDTVTINSSLKKICSTILW